MYGNQINRKYSNIESTFDKRKNTLDPTSRPKKLNFHNKNTRNKFGILTTQYDEFTAEQSILDYDMVKMREDILTQNIRDIETEFTLATDHENNEQKGARTLFSSAVEKEQNELKKKLKSNKKLNSPT